MNLRAFQDTGADWLAARPRAALCDEMGLGKTVTAIVAADRARIGRVLVLVPTCVLYNWAHEIGVWSPARTVQVLAEGKARIDPLADVLVTTHGLLLNDALRARLLAWAPELVILDESHFFRSPAARRTRLFYGQVAKAGTRIWCLSGTPMPNDASELWSMCHHLWPERFPLDFEAFRAHYCVTGWSPYGDGVKVLGNKPDTLPELRQKLDGAMLRRTKALVMQDLPPVRYETVTLRPTKMPQELAELEGELAGKVRELMAQATTPGEAYEVLSEHAGFARYRRLCGLAKATVAADLVDMELDSGALRKVVIFAHHTDVVAAIAVRLHRYGVQQITGATRPDERQRAVRLFQTDAGTRVIVCNIVAGGTGTTLTAAADVVFVELSPVPGENAQAADRIRRIGQTQDCRVRFIALAGTIDEPIVAVLQRKTLMIREVLQ